MGKPDGEIIWKALEWVGKLQRTCLKENELKGVNWICVNFMFMVLCIAGLY